MVRRFRRSVWAWSASGLVFVALGIATLAYGLARHGEFRPIESFNFESGTILGSCSIFGSGCETYDSTPWFVLGGAFLFVGLILAALAAHRARI